MNKILIIENDENIFFAFNEILKKEGFTAIASVPDRDAINNCWDDYIQAIYYDITDQNEEDIKTIQSIRNSKSSVPIVLISGQETRDKLNQLKHYGDFEAIEKPFSISSIRHSLQKVSNQKFSRPANYARAENYMYNGQFK